MSVDFSLGQVAVAVGGVPEDATHALRKISGVAVDSRQIAEGYLFFALSGENEDGHKYLAAAAEKGALAAVVAKSYSGIAPQGLVLIRVEDTLKALHTLAKVWRQELAAPLIAVTGSFGKTTTKEILRAILKNVVGPGTANDKSYNNHVGLPLTLLAASRSDKWLVLEAGMNHPGELEMLGAVCQPTVVVELGVGPVHLEHFKSVEEIAQAKCELITHLRDGGTVVYAADDPILSRAVEEKTKGRKVLKVRFAATGLAELLISGAKTDKDGLASGEFQSGGGAYSVKLQHRGVHNLRNAAAAVLAAQAAFPEFPLGAWCVSLLSATPPQMRLEILERENLTIINDAYNANPVSMAAALTTAAEMARGKKLLAVLGDMRELGPTSPQLHFEIGQRAAAVGVTKLIVLGERGPDLLRGARESGLNEGSVAPSIEGAVEAVLDYLRGGEPTIVLVKASRGMELERVVQGILLSLEKTKVQEI